MEVTGEGFGNLKVESRAPCVISQEKPLGQTPNLMVAVALSG